MSFPLGVVSTGNKPHQTGSGRDNNMANAHSWACTFLMFIILWSIRMPAIYTGDKIPNSAASTEHDSHLEMSFAVRRPIRFVVV